MNGKSSLPHLQIVPTTSKLKLLPNVDDSKRVNGKMHDDRSQMGLDVPMRPLLNDPLEYP